MAVNQQQLDYLSAIGVPVWISRDLPMPELPVSSFNLDENVSSPAPIVSENGLIKPSTAQGLKSADKLIQDLQQTTSVPQIAELAASLDDAVQARPEVILKELDGVDWIELQKAVSQCTACDLHDKRQHTVFGKGNQQASLMFVGDIPRLLDEQLKQPFSGEAGELLNSMLDHLEVEPDSVYFTSLLKCRPPLDGSPQANQAASCLSYLRQQIKLLNPSLVVLLGRHSAQQVLGKVDPMSQLRQTQHTAQGYDTRFIATYHPAYLLKQPRLKVLVWKDLQFIKQALNSHG